MCRAFIFCKKHKKQIFIAIDGQDKCNEISKEIIKKSTVIQLGENENSLFA